MIKFTMVQLKVVGNFIDDAYYVTDLGYPQTNEQNKIELFQTEVVSANTVF